MGAHLQQEKANLISSLTSHCISTLADLRRVEKSLTIYDQAELYGAMTAAWAHYVNSNNLLSDLRGLTKSYPFSSELLDEAKWMVIEDPASQNSWNYCWLVLAKIQEQYVPLF